MSFSALGVGFDSSAKISSMYCTGVPSFLSRAPDDPGRWLSNGLASDRHSDRFFSANQNRSLWDRALIAEAQGLIDRALLARRVGPYLLQAALAAVHAEPSSEGKTDWAQIVGLYDVLRRVDPSPVVALNRAAALGMRDGPEAGLAAIEAVLGQGGLDDHYMALAASADMQRRLGLAEAARASYQRALELTRQPAERRFLQVRLDQ